MRSECAAAKGLRASKEGVDPCGPAWRKKKRSAARRREIGRLSWGGKEEITCRCRLRCSRLLKAWLNEKEGGAASIVPSGRGGGA